MSTMTPAPVTTPAASGATGDASRGAIPRTRRTARKTRSAAVKAVLVVLLLGFTLFPAFWMLSSAFDKSAGAGGQTLEPGRAGSVSSSPGGISSGTDCEACPSGAVGSSMAMP